MNEDDTLNMSRNKDIKSIIGSNPHVTLNLSYEKKLFFIFLNINQFLLRTKLFSFIFF